MRIPFGRRGFVAPLLAVTLIGSVIDAGPSSAQESFHWLQSSGEAGLASWTVEAVTAPLNFDYFNAAAQLSRASAWFTHDGWAAFISRPGSSAQLERVKAGKMLCHANVRNDPLVLDEHAPPGGPQYVSHEVSFTVVQTCENLNEAFTVGYVAKARVVWSTGGTAPGVPLVDRLTLTDLP